MRALLTQVDVSQKCHVLVTLLSSRDDVSHKHFRNTDFKVLTLTTRACTCPTGYIESGNHYRRYLSPRTFLFIACNNGLDRHAWLICSFSRSLVLVNVVLSKHQKMETGANAICRPDYDPFWMLFKYAPNSCRASGKRPS